MASLTLTLTDVCAGGEHLTITVTGARSGVWRTTRSELGDAVPTMEEVCRMLMKLYSVGKTPLQVKTALQAGITITVG